jgi:hypothetical protein
MLQLNSPITCVHDRFSAWDSWPTKKKKKIILHVRIDPEKKVRNDKKSKWKMEYQFMQT